MPIADRTVQIISQHSRLADLTAKVQGHPPEPHAQDPLRILVVDDSRMQRRILCALLAQDGYTVLEAASAEEALRICARVEPDIVLSDWFMPGLSGIDFCRAFRSLPRRHYGYFILLSSQAEKCATALGLDSGADDVLLKPVNGIELRSRLAAGRRILAIERSLTDRNRELSARIEEMQGLHDSIDRDLAEACKLQQSLIRERFRSFGAAQVSLILRPSGHVGGDLVGFFPINARRVGLYGIDVSGHGITSALLAARISGYLSGSSPEQNIALMQTDLGIYDAREPHELAELLNRLVLEEIETESYFTLIYADVDLVSGRVAFVQAGHPAPVVLRADGRTETVGEGGMPVGLIPGAAWETVEFTLSPGDRVLFGSDGLTEATDPTGGLLGEDGLARLMCDLAEKHGPDLLDALYTAIEAQAGGRLGDDISAILFEFYGAKRNAD